MKKSTHNRLIALLLVLFMLVSMIPVTVQATEADPPTLKPPPRPKASPRPSRSPSPSRNPSHSPSHSPSRSRNPSHSPSHSPSPSRRRYRRSRPPGRMLRWRERWTTAL